MLSGTSETYKRLPWEISGRLEYSFGAFFLLIQAFISFGSHREQFLLWQAYFISRKAWFTCLGACPNFLPSPGCTSLVFHGSVFLSSQRCFIPIFLFTFIFSTWHLGSSHHAHVPAEETSPTEPPQKHTEVQAWGQDRGLCSAASCWTCPGAQLCVQDPSTVMGALCRAGPGVAKGGPLRERKQVQWQERV